MGLGTGCSVSRKRIPCPPQTGTVKETQRLTNLQFGDRHDKLPAPLPDETVLRDNFFLQVPGQDEKIIRSCLTNPFWRKDGNARPRGELTLLIAASIDRVGKQVGANPAVVKQGVALPRGAVAGDRLARLFGLDKKLQDLALGRFDLLRESLVSMKIPDPPLSLRLFQSRDV